MSHIINIILTPFSTKVEMAPGCFVRYVRNRPVAVLLEAGWVIL